ncbi:phosphoenolpyruvate--protein phosphotransferase [Anaerotruncus massiliensis (ex Liu et al. 2021)]|uniref:Phosphoenolpyruvate-protein phosphotransferase n=2 Tax=Anaerotruncus TaxID=244127 RepID=A0A498D121_9FIRM|nr:MULTISPECIES: phosphoenolpyruvate--protein phosphotransferase [Anaerotruncus]MBC3938063.1 phosphoenolpyruvate--protein phosphotransferase [Anaerotruncus massiliensis (ex Togo et al. 2019)]RLL13630.1 phosphoenolpyruvate--protein phosphotransferase [Anaerotruncus massiliensis (ex Liu et al. 2021)]
MIVLNGKSVFGGIAFGRLAFYERRQQNIHRRSVDDPQAEIARFEDAKTKAVEQLEALYQKALVEVGETNAMIFQIHQMMLEDLDYCDSVTNIITSQGVNAEYAVGVTADNFAQMFSAMDDPYMQGRAADVKDVSERLVNVLCGVQSAGVDSVGPVVIAADDLAPSETVQLDKNKILAFVTKRGSANSHTAILARTMNIPAVIGVGDALEEAYNGREVIVDGFCGQIYVDPDAETTAALREKWEKENDKRRLLQELRGKENVTVDGQKVLIYANIGSPSDMGAVLANDAGGIGLFRSEFLYLESSGYPSEEEQFAAYRTVAETAAGKRVVIRTLDIGADKQVDYFQLPKEDNPAMGYRAIRICLTREDVFKTQLRALYRASAFGNIAIMFPMITSVWEVREIKRIAAEVREELKAAGIPYSEEVELGIMIETPAAAMISDRLAPEVDFFSIGTNDLTQYTLAIDRQNQKLERFYDAHHPAILRFIKLVADNAHKAGIWMGICGELAADPELTETFLAIGVDELSVSPPYVLELRRRVRETNVAEVREKLLAAFME